MPLHHSHTGSPGQAPGLHSVTHVSSSHSHNQCARLAPLESGTSPCHIVSFWGVQQTARRRPFCLIWCGSARKRMWIVGGLKSGRGYQRRGRREHLQMSVKCTNVRGRVRDDRINQPIYPIYLCFFRSFLFPIVCSIVCLSWFLSGG